MTSVACVGECMIELKQAAGGLFSRGYGGDTLNTAVYLARLGVATDYVTALGEDAMSAAMLDGWAAEGIGIARVQRLAGKLPGLYMIETDGRGERRFFHWRDSAAARELMRLPQTGELLDSLAGDDIVYLSAITLSLYGEEGRVRLFAALKHARTGRTRIAFDTNFRARGWPDLEAARRVYGEMFAIADIVLASTEDLLPLYPAASEADLLTRIPSPETVLKRAEPACIVREDGSEQIIRAAPLTHPVVDTTAAGDSFAAAYLAARHRGFSPREAADAGHRLAGVVVGYPGAIIPREAMPSDVLKR